MLTSCELSVLNLALPKAGNPKELLPQFHRILASRALGYEITVIDEQANDETRQVDEANRAQLLGPATDGYGLALAAGFQAGVAVVNAGTDGSEPHMPFGGARQSGNGTRELGIEALDLYSDLKDIYLNIDPAQL